MKKPFTQEEKKLLYGISQKLGNKHRCSGMYVRMLINGQRKTTSPLSKHIIEDLEALLAVLHHREL